MIHHTIDPYPIPEKSPIYINEPWLIDASKEPQMKKDVEKFRQPDDCEDNVRIYIPMDLNHDAILRRLDYVINKYEEASGANEFRFGEEVSQIIAQLEIYDQIRYIRHMPKEGGKHSPEAVALAKDIITKLEGIEDAGAEMFPFELIEELKEEFGIR